MMMRTVKPRAFCVTVGLLILTAAILPVAGVLGEDAASQVPPPPPPSPSAATATAVSTPSAGAVTSTPTAPAARDPTVPGAELRAVLEKNRRATAAPVLLPPPPKIPEIVRQAFIQVAGKPARAIIEAGGARHTVAAGSQFTVDAGQGTSLTLRVVCLTVDEIEIEIPSLHQTRVVR